MLHARTAALARWSRGHSQTRRLHAASRHAGAACRCGMSFVVDGVPRSQYTPGLNGTACAAGRRQEAVARHDSAQP